MSVKITANPETKKVFTLSLDSKGQPRLDKNGNKHGYIRVESKQLNLGFGYSKSVKVRSALIAMTEESFNAGADLMVNGAVIPGKIVHTDSLEQAWEGQEPLQFPSRDEKGVVIEGEFTTVTSGGAPVYRSTKYTEDENAQDSLLSYDREEAAAPAVVNAAKKNTVIAE